MLDIKDLKKLHIAIATPCYGAQVCQNYLMSIIRLIYDAQQYGLNLSFIIRGGDSLIPRTRNSIVGEFMDNKEYTHLLWIDADIGFDTAAVFRLLLTDRDVVAGVYPLKKIVWPEGGIPEGMSHEEFGAEYTQYPYNPGGVQAVIDEQGFMEVLDAPTGLMCIKRQVFVDMAKAYPGLRFRPDRMLGLEGIESEQGFNYRFFDVMTEENGRYLSEDYAFCRRWQTIGGKVYADARSKLTHQGTHIYTGDFLASVLAKSSRIEKENALTASTSTAEQIVP